MNSDFENKLQRQPLREIPPHWRARILANAKPAQNKWVEWLQPWPQAWAVLGAAWVLIFIFQIFTPNEPGLVRQSYQPQPYAILQEQRMLAKLISADDDRQQTPALPAEAKPRSERTRRKSIG